MVANDSIPLLREPGVVGANNAISKLVELGFLHEVTGKTYGRVYACYRVMEIVDRPASAGEGVVPELQQES